MNNQRTEQVPLTACFDRLLDAGFKIVQKPTRTVSPTQPLLSMLDAGLRAPVNYPAMQEFLFAGDHVAIALQSGLEHAHETLESLLICLSRIGIESSDITLVIPASLLSQLKIKSPFADTASVSPESFENSIFAATVCGHEIKIQIHDSDQSALLSYLTANEGGDPIHINRVLVDADVIVPVGFAATNAAGTTSSLYPQFASRAVLDRFQDSDFTAKSRHEEIELANTTLGVFFAIQLVFGPGGQVENIFCGNRQQVSDLAQLASDEVWAVDQHSEGDSVFATIETENQSQTWDDFAAAVEAAQDLAPHDGPIVIWSEIEQRPDRETRSACQSQFDESKRPKKSASRQRLATILQERPVYLRSRLGRDLVEGLGLGYINEPSELLRICESCSHGLILRDAHRCQIRTTSQAVSG